RLSWTGQRRQRFRHRAHREGFVPLVSHRAADANDPADVAVSRAPRAVSRRTSDLAEWKLRFQICSVGILKSAIRNRFDLAEPLNHSRPIDQMHQKKI